MDRPHERRQVALIALLLLAGWAFDVWLVFLIDPWWAGAALGLAHGVAHYACCDLMWMSWD